MKFVKMHGIGNDYIYLDAFTAPDLDRRADLPALARAMSHRHTGVGSDGLILVCRPREASAHVRMRMFNADGSEAEMCGNGIRCVAKFAHDRLNLRHRPLRVETGRGVLSIDYTLDAFARLAGATVDMGEPVLDLPDIPVDREHLQRTDIPHEWLLAGAPAGGGERWVFVSMGNPHAVCFTPPSALAFTPPRPQDSRGAVDPLARLGPILESHRAFPNRANIHHVVVVSPREARMRTWERGTGLTQACGTGACAVLVAGVLTGRLGCQAIIRLPGGDISIRWDESSNRVFMTGPAADVFEGDWPEDR